MANNSGKSFNLRAFTSVLTGLSFVLMTVTGLMLFFAPACRVARETSWTVWGHDKDQWVVIHVWLSIAFVIASLIHVYLNWAALLGYFRSKVHKGWALRVEWVAALAICVVLYVGAVRGVAPFSSLMAWKETFKHDPAAAEAGRGWRGGRMAGQNYQNQATQTLEDQTDATPVSAGQQDDCGQSQIGGHGPGSVTGGMGRMTLRQFCTNEGIELSWAISQLKSKGLTVRDTMTLREIADAAGVHPRELHTLLQTR